MSKALARAFPSAQFPAFLAIVAHAAEQCKQPAVDSLNIDDAAPDARYPGRNACIVTGNDWTAYVACSAGQWFYIHEATRAE